MLARATLIAKSAASVAQRRFVSIDRYTSAHTEGAREENRCGRRYGVAPNATIRFDSRHEDDDPRIPSRRSAQDQHHAGQPQ